MAITNGKYKARATGEVILGESAEKRTPFIEFYFQITSGENAGGQVRWTGYFTDKADKKGRTGAERVISSLQFCGWDGDDLSEFSDKELHGLDTNEVEIVVELEHYEKDGEQRTVPKVQWVNKIGEYLNIQNAMPKEKADSFGAKMRGLVLKAKAKNGVPSDADAAFDHGANKKASGERKGW